ncbi:MAG TPA: TetR/AcrR family transcriptional regulator [Gemmatimonadaceae bacterium]|nr:TetR/AcrR family transcriptional regulator [Gemmatimonadaceae bacterium]
MATVSKTPRAKKTARPPSKRPTAKRGGGTREKQKEAIRERIVEAALTLFQSKGFDQTTTRQIAQKAKLAEGTIFNYFETKEDIALHFLQLEVDHAIAAVRTNPKLRRAPLEEKLFVLVEAQLEFLAPHEKFIGAAFVHALRPTSKIAFSMQALDLRNRYLGFVQELIEESDSVPPGSLLTWAAPSVFWIYYVGILLYWLNDASKGKQHTLALLDRSLRFGVAMLRKGSV